MQNLTVMTRLADRTRAFNLDQYYFELECEKSFRRMRRRAMADSFRRLFAKGRRIKLGGQSLIGRRSTDSMKSLSIPIDEIRGYVDASGRPLPGRKALGRGFFPLWRATLERGGIDSLPRPRAYRVDGGWYLESGVKAVLALEAARALGAAELRLALPLRSLEEVGGAGTAAAGRGIPPAPPSELLAG